MNEFFSWFFLATSFCLLWQLHQALNGWKESLKIAEEYSDVCRQWERLHQSSEETGRYFLTRAVREAHERHIAEGGQP